MKSGLCARTDCVFASQFNWSRATSPTEAAVSTKYVEDYDSDKENDHEAFCFSSKTHKPANPARSTECRHRRHGMPCTHFHLPQSSSFDVLLQPTLSEGLCIAMLTLIHCSLLPLPGQNSHNPNNHYRCCKIDVQAAKGAWEAGRDSLQEYVDVANKGMVRSLRKIDTPFSK